LAEMKRRYDAMFVNKRTGMPVKVGCLTKVNP